MDNRINQNKINKTEFQGIKPKTKGAKSMEELIKKMISNLLEREREIAEYGEFGNKGMIFEQFSNPDKNLAVDKFWLEIAQAPKGAENYQTKRTLKFVASKLGAPEAEILIESGTKADILAKLKDQNLPEKLKSYTEKLSYNLRDL
ncbi:hypothetical protein IKQ21_03285 [bacterium]|nr:hypothetical protein [bacterium]